jgi:HK97 family phage portal protein
VGVGTWLRRVFLAEDIQVRDAKTSFITFEDVWGVSARQSRWASHSGVVVTQDSAVTFSAVYAAVGLISETIAALPLGLYARFPDGSRYARPKPPWMDQPNAETGWFEFVCQTLVSLLLDGNAFWYVVRDALGVARELWILDPRQVRVQRDAERNLTYLIQNQKLAPSEIVHLRGLTLPGYLRGLSPIEGARQTIGLGLAAEEFAGRFYANNAALGGVLEMPVGTTPEQGRVTRDLFNEDHQGLANSSKVGVLLGAAYKPVAITQEQAQFLETRRFQVTEVARWFRIPPHMIGEVSGSTSWGTGIEQQQIAFVTHTLTPWIVRLEAALTPLVREFATVAAIGTNADWSPKFNVNGLLRGDMAARSAFYKSLWEMGAFSPNFILAKEDENPYPGGDAHYVQASYAVVGPDGVPVLASTPAAPIEEGTAA